MLQSSEIKNVERQVTALHDLSAASFPGLSEAVRSLSDKVCALKETIDQVCNLCLGPGTDHPLDLPPC